MGHNFYWKLIGCEEHYEFQKFVTEIIDNKEKRNQFYDKLLEHVDLEDDIFRDYFESYASERKSNQQDYTPKALAKVCVGMLDDFDCIADYCAGTGSLLIEAFNKNKKTKFIAWEKTNTAIPYLIHNMCIRNAEGIVVKGDSISMNSEVIYKLSKGDKYSNIEVVENYDYQPDAIIMNPPYSAKWEAEKFKDDERFKFGIAPKSKADYAFIQSALSNLKQGSGVFILPHGILFRGASEGKIRKGMIDEKIIDSVIGMAPNLFTNTSIPVCVVKFNLNNCNDDMLFIDASKEFEKQKSQNIMNEEHIQKILNAYRERKDIDKFAHVASLEEIKENDYNLNIPRYVDTFEEEEEIDIHEVMKELRELEAKRNELDKEINVYLKELGILED